MENASNRELTDQAVYPDEKILSKVLGRSYASFIALLELFDLNEMHYEWRYYMDGKSWLLKVQKNKKTIIWMSAWKGFMKAGIYIPERLLDSLYALPLSEETMERIRTTENVGKSKPCIFDIRNQKVLKDLEMVMQFKIRAK